MVKLLILTTLFATFAMNANVAVSAAPVEDGMNFEPSHIKEYPVCTPVISTSANTLTLISDTFANTLALV